MENNQFIMNIIDAFFYGVAPTELVKCCPVNMLWEAIKAEDAVFIETKNIPEFLVLEDAIFAMPEPIPAIQRGVEPEYQRINCSELMENNKAFFWELVKQEPMYLVSYDYKWMIALTTENTRHGTQLCAIVRGKKTGGQGEGSREPICSTVDGSVC